MRARVSSEWRCQPPEVTSVFCKGCVCLYFKLCLGIHFFSREQGRVKRLGRGAQEHFPQRVCVDTTQLGF